MKRSEVIKIINDVLKGGYDDPANTILTKLEDVGMLPPEIKTEVIDEKIGLGYTIRANIWSEE